MFFNGPSPVFRASMRRLRTFDVVSIHSPIPTLMESSSRAIFLDSFRFGLSASLGENCPQFQAVEDLVRQAFFFSKPQIEPVRVPFVLVRHVHDRISPSS